MDTQMITDSMENRLAAIRAKVEKLLVENQALKADHDAMRERVDSFEKTIELQKNTIAELTERNKMIKLAKNLSLSSSDSFDIKIKINEMVREIDRCIDLLNE
jgi:regulator of replication initiation timing